MAIKKKFKSRLGSTKFIFKNGKAANFVPPGEFLTDVESEIEELNAEITGGNVYLYIDSLDSEVDTNALSPLEELKRKAVAEFCIANGIALPEAGEEVAIPVLTDTVAAPAAPTSEIAKQAIAEVKQQAKVMEQLNAEAQKAVTPGADKAVGLFQNAIITSQDLVTAPKSNG